MSFPVPRYAGSLDDGRENHSARTPNSSIHDSDFGSLSLRERVRVRAPRRWRTCNDQRASNGQTLTPALSRWRLARQPTKVGPAQAGPCSAYPVTAPPPARGRLHRGITRNSPVGEAVVQTRCERRSLPRDGSSEISEDSYCSAPATNASVISSSGTDRISEST